MRRDFQLREEDIQYLESLGFQWETITDCNMEWLIIQEFPLPLGYNIMKVNVALKIESGYPRTQLDMAYFYPAIERADKKAINATSIQSINGLNYQRWSRHRTQANPWREGVDDLSTHMSLVEFWFEQEFIKNPNGIAA